MLPRFPWQVALSGHAAAITTITIIIATSTFEE